MMAKKKSELNLSVAQKAINTERQGRANACWQEIQAALKRHSCRLSYSITLTSEGGCVPRLGVIAMDNTIMPGPLPPGAMN